jgi:hypothetical protein
LAVYDQVLHRLGAVRNNARFRREEVSALLGSTYALRRLHRMEEAKRRLDTAFQRLQELDMYPADRVRLGSEADDALRARAEWEADAGNAASGAAQYRDLLRHLEGPQPQASINATVEYSNIYRAAAALERRAGHLPEAAELDRQRLAMWQHWARKLPSNPYIARQLAPVQPRDLTARRP